MRAPMAGWTASLLGGLLAILLGLAASPVQADNLVVNPGFDTDVNGWTVNNAAWDGTHDAEGSAASGSARSFRFLAGPNDCIDTISQCVTGLSGGARYDFGGKILIPTSLNQTTGGQGSIDVQWYSDTCGSALLRTDLGPTVDSTANADVWTPSSASGVTAPSGTTSARLTGRNCVLGVGNVEIFFDDMFLQPSPAFTPAVPVLDRGGLAVLVLLLGSCGLLALRRR